MNPAAKKLKRARVSHGDRGRATNVNTRIQSDLAFIDDQAAGEASAAR